MITLEMFKALCTFDRVTPRFLDFILGLGRKTKSFDEDFIACYHQFSTGEEIRREALADNGDGDHGLDFNGKLQAQSYGQCIITIIYGANSFSPSHPKNI